MEIIVIDKGPDLFWYVSGALREDEIGLKHVTNLADGESVIVQAMPSIVIMSGDEGYAALTKFISQMRNHVFARNTNFIVFTSSMDVADRRAYLQAGVGYVFYRTQSQNASPKYFRNVVRWLMSSKAPDQNIFDYKPSQFKAESELTTYGRIGWISPTHMLIETNLSLDPGDTIDFNCPLFDELGFKNPRLQCTEKNRVGRYYQYSNSLLCKISTKSFDKDQKRLASYIEQNKKTSKGKSLKTVFFEPNFENRKIIKEMVKGDARYCARGYHTLDDFLEVLRYQMPQLVLINRSLIAHDPGKFDPMKKFGQNNFCYCVTYSDDPIFDIEEFKKNHPYAMHAKGLITSEVLDGMISKLQTKISTTAANDDDRLYLSKNSMNSKINLTSPCLVSEIGQDSFGIYLPYIMSNFCAFEVSAHPFTIGRFGRVQFFRTFFSKIPEDRSKGIYHRAMVMGQIFKDQEAVKDTINQLSITPYERWVIGDYDKRR